MQAQLGRTKLPRRYGSYESSFSQELFTKKACSEIATGSSRTLRLGPEVLVRLSVVTSRPSTSASSAGIIACRSDHLSDPQTLIRSLAQAQTLSR